MKKLHKIVLSLLLVLSLVACASSSDRNGTWEIVRLEDSSGTIDQDFMDETLKAMKEENIGTLFSIEIGDVSYLIQDGERYEITVDFDKNVIIDEFGYELPFEFKNRQLRLTDTGTGLVFVMEKVSD